MITEKMSKRLGTHVTMRQASKLNATDDVESIVKVGDEVEIGDPLIVFGLGDTGDKAVDAFLKAFQSDSNSLDTAKRIIKSKHAGTVKEIRMYTTKGMDKLSPSLFELLDAHFKENIQKRKILDKHDKSNSVYKLDTLYSLPTEPINGQSIKGQHCDVMIEIYIEHGDDVSIGDKCVVYAASKQVISEVIPEGQEPFTEDDPETEISMFVSAGSIMKRMIPSMIVTASANKILVELKRHIGKIWNG
jgi:DNA-directed RNA polymerase beta subunit